MNEKEKMIFRNILKMSVRIFKQKPELRSRVKVLQRRFSFNPLHKNKYSDLLLVQSLVSMTLKSGPETGDEEVKTVLAEMISKLDLALAQRAEEMKKL